jgi:hypothetical protein
MVKKNEAASKKEKINSEADKKVEQILIENFVSLQKVMTNLAVKFDNLSGQISKLLDLFEISAKTLAEKDYSSEEGKSDKKIAEKLDNVLEQNKIIARGVALLHENNSHEEQKFPIQNTQRLYSSMPPQNPQAGKMPMKPFSRFQNNAER